MPIRHPNSTVETTGPIRTTPLLASPKYGNRVTSSGKKLGPEERITPFEALRAITADAAWQNFEENQKGTLETGKLADMVVLSDDPLRIDPMAIKDIRVMQTIKEGETVYLAKG